MPMRVIRAGLKYRAISVLIITLSALLAWQLVLNSQHWSDLREERDRQARQFCIAIPNVAEASAQALIDVVLDDQKRRGLPEARIERTKKLGALYTARARALATEDLPECDELLNGDKEAPMAKWLKRVPYLTP